MAEMWFGEQMEGDGTTLFLTLYFLQNLPDRAIMHQVRKQHDRQSRCHLKLILVSYMVSSNLKKKKHKH